MDAIKVDIVHTFDGPATALLESLANALITRSTTVKEAIGDVSVTTTTTEPATKAAAEAAGVEGQREGSVPPSPVRERGKPSVGKRKRTKAQMAEDDAADAADVVTAADAAASATPDPEKFMKELRELCREYNKANGREATSALFEGLSGGGVSTILPSEFSRLRDRLIAAGAGAPPAPDEANASIFDL